MSDDNLAGYEREHVRAEKEYQLRVNEWVEKMERHPESTAVQVVELEDNCRERLREINRLNLQVNRLTAERVLR